MYDSLHTVKETAAILSVSPKLVREQIRIGNLRSLTFGRGYKIRRSEIDRFINTLDKKQNGVKDEDA